MAKPQRSPSRPGKSGAAILSVKVTLRHIKPPIWRRLLIPARMTLGDLHDAIQAAMGWESAHLHAFDVDGTQYGDRSILDDVVDENRMTLGGVARSGVSRFAYVYDFGDGWAHSVLIEARAPATDLGRYPACVAGKRKCPPEDCGGPWGYQHLLEVLADPAHPEHAEQREWLGEELDPEEFDPEEFDLVDANAGLAARFAEH